MMDLEDHIAKIIKDEYEVFTGGHADAGHADVAAHEIMALIKEWDAIHDAVVGNLDHVSIEGQVWVRRDTIDRHVADLEAKGGVMLGENGDGEAV
jgi:hypothetical protein